MNKAELYTTGSIKNISQPHMGTLLITAANQDRRLYRIWNGVKTWTLTEDQLYRYGWRMVQPTEQQRFEDTCDMETAYWRDHPHG